MKHERHGARSLVLSDGSTHVLTYRRNDNMEHVETEATGAGLVEALADIAERIDNEVAANKGLTPAQRAAKERRDKREAATRAKRAHDAVQNAVEKFDTEEAADKPQDKAYTLDEARHDAAHVMHVVETVGKDTAGFIAKVVERVKGDDPIGRGCAALVRLNIEARSLRDKGLAAKDDADTIRKTIQAMWARAVPALKRTETVEGVDVKVSPSSWNTVCEAVLEMAGYPGAEGKELRAVDNAVRYAAEVWAKDHGVIIAKPTVARAKRGKAVKFYVSGLGGVRRQVEVAWLSPATIEGLVQNAGPRTARDFATAVLLYLDKLAAAAPPSKRATKAA